MTFLIAAAGTGGHVFPGLAVGEALTELGVAQADIVYVGGDRLEATVYPGNGFRFFGVELAGLRRSLTPTNLRIPGVVLRARDEIAGEIESSKVEVALGMGGYVTIPAGLAARQSRIPFFNAEQNAEAGLANRVATRWARATFTSFPTTGGLPGGTWVGNPVRRPFWGFERDLLSREAREHYAVGADRPVLGVFGGSLGAKAINDAVAEMLEYWEGPRLQVVHLTGDDHLESIRSISAPATVEWVRRGFEDRMELFYAVSDLVVARAGGAVAELTATATPSVLIPGSFGSGGHQAGNASGLASAGAAVVITEGAVSDLSEVVRRLVSDDAARADMAAAARAISKPEAALTIASAMIEAAS
jgi:UDP-N-acetylglucosamine--N-acetylmuramyl-(pentapeptide) pyrophosphoryl-undecaprenol N-acetylglucosamine transferase